MQQDLSDDDDDDTGDGDGDGDGDDDDDDDGDDDGCLRVVALAAKITARHSCSGGATNNPRGHSTRIKDKKERERKKTRALKPEGEDGIVEEFQSQ